MKDPIPLPEMSQEPSLKDFSIDQTNVFEAAQRAYLRDSARVLTEYVRRLEAFFDRPCECEGEYFTDSPAPRLSQCQRCKELDALREHIERNLR